MWSDRSGTPQRVPGFLIRTSTDRRLVDSSPWLIAVTHVLLRLQAPRHPPLALCSLENKDARARYGVLKGLERTARGASSAAAARGRPAGRRELFSPKEVHSLPQNGTEDRLEPASTAPRRFLPRKQQSPTTGQTEDGAKPVINWEFLS